MRSGPRFLCWRRLALLLALSPSVFGLGGCYTYHVYQYGGPDHREMGNQPGTEWQHARLNSWLWGFVRQDLPIENARFVDGRSLGIEELRVDTNFGYALISVLSLGIWVPVDVSWRCAKPPVSSATLQ